MPNVLLGVTGSVAAIKIPELVEKLQAVSSIQIDLQIISTKSALHFFDPAKLPVKCYRDEDEWVWKQKGDPVLHIELRKWADLLLIAPLDANTMAKIASGLCDNLLTCVVRAWDPVCPLVYCPAMNTYMWEHPLTSTQSSILKGFGYTEVPPISKTLACGDTGIGAMANVDDIVSSVIHNLKTKSIEKQDHNM